jgi:adenosylhomocysteine nucleosidase
MWQMLLRNYLLRTAAEQMRASQQQKAAGAPGTSQPPGAASDAAPQEPIDTTPPVCHVGLVYALSIESGGLIDLLSGVIQIKGAGFIAREGALAGRRLVVVEAGAGRENAAHATRALIAGHQPRWIISAGFAGGLQPSLRYGDILMANEIVDLAGHRLGIDFKVDPAVLAATPRLHVGRLLTVDSVVYQATAKQALGQTHGALAVDMESSAVAQVCREERVRFLSVRVISDAVDHELPSDVDHLVRQKSTLGRLGAAAGAIARRPSSVKDMWRLKEDAIAASDRLAKFLSGIVPQLD